MSLDVAGEEVGGEGRVAGHLAQHGARVGDRVGIVDVAGQPPAWLAEAAPERPHELVQRDRPVAALTKRQVEAKANRLTPRVIGDESVVEAGAVDGGRRVDERRHPAHLLSGPQRAPRRERHRVDRGGGIVDVVAQRRESGAAQDERLVVVREAFGQPELPGHIGVLEVERLERARPDPLHVPRVEELVRGRGHQVDASSTDR